VLAYHYLGVATAHLFGTPEQRDAAYRQTVQEGLFWGNALNPLDRRASYADGRLNGPKSFCSGSGDSDRLLVSAVQADNPRLFVAIVPTLREGVRVLDDWDNMGQRQTDSGSVELHNVEVLPHEVLSTPGPGGSPWATLRTCLVQLILAEIYLGIAEGAFEAARSYTRAETRPQANGEPASRDPLMQRQYGELWVQLQAALSLMEKAEAALDAAWLRESDLTAEERGQCAVAVATAKIAATRTSLDLTTRMFELMGARATSARYGFDRFWRNARTLTLHDPLDAKLTEVGGWVLNDEPPKPGLYS
jgi:alkylation response protein AidB-like acyl-CoA dehydrogenase